MLAVESVARALAGVQAREATVHAWACLDGDRALDEAARLDAAVPSAPLRGLVLGVKDIFDTADFPTEYGSLIYRHHRPRRDADVVAMLRAAGAVCLGKTVTSELAMFTAGPTVNPHRAGHTPGGSSSGSAAAVAARMADIAVGSQTAGSVIRPASFCGVFGFKPTFGSLPVAGMKLVAPSLDTVGLFARSAATLSQVWAALTGSPVAGTPARPPRVRVVRGDDWDAADADCRGVIEAAGDRAAAAGAEVTLHELPEEFIGLTARQPVVQAYEAARSLASERDEHSEQISEGLRGILDWGAAIDTDEYRAVVDAAQRARDRADDLFAAADVLLTPAVKGEAPAGLADTGDPRYARLWTLLGWPTITVPGLCGSTGLPIGVQLVGRPHADRDLLIHAAWLAEQLTPDIERDGIC